MKSRRPPSRRPSSDGGRARRPVKEKDRLRWTVGIHSVAEALSVRPRAISELWIRKEWRGHPGLTQIAEKAQEKRVNLVLKDDGQLDQLAMGHQGVAAGLSQTPEVDWARFESPGPHMVLVLDGIEDPQNLGAILRTAWLTGVEAVFTPADRAVGLTPTVCKVASGGVEHVPVERCGSFATVFEELKQKGFWFFGLAEKGPRPVWDFELPEKVAWVVGAEGHGLRTTTERACDELFFLPQALTGSSYNASVATAMALYETMRQRKPQFSL